MQSIRFLYKVGRGPSSSHTMGPWFAAKKIKEKYPEANYYKITVYNSLALTGEGHLTYAVLKDTLAPNKVEFTSRIDYHLHPNTLDFNIYKNDELLQKIIVKSIGGGEVVFNDQIIEHEHIYPHNSFQEIKEYCLNKNISLYDYVKEVEGNDIDQFLLEIWNQMQDTIKNGLINTGILPGELKVNRRAKDLMTGPDNESEAFMENRLVSAYAFAVNEENASGGIVVTAPTCGASGTLPAVLYYFYKTQNLNTQQIIEALATAGLFGNLIKHNATISGAVGGCQSEVGSACSMTAAAHSTFSNSTIDQIEYAAEIAMEHHLGLTCDPIGGYVQIPCIERNAVAAIRAINASRISHYLSGTRKISFDMIIKTMYQTGLDMHPKYKETAEAGMAYFYNEQNHNKDN